MQFLQDNLSASIIAGLSLLMMVGVNNQTQQESIKQQLLYQTRTQLFTLADVLAWDLNNAGYSTTPGQQGITRYNATTVFGVPVTDDIEVWTADPNGNRIQVRYTLTAVDTTTIEGTTVPLFQLRRYEDGALSAESTPTLTSFNIELLTLGGGPANPNSARQLRVRLRRAVAPSLDAGITPTMQRELYWGTSLTPPNLRGYQGG
jgi:hypothetical protein